MQVGESYDVIVIGNQLSGYLLAAAAAERGKRVLVIESQVRESALFEKPSGDFMLDLHWEPLIGLAKGGEEDAFLRRLGVYAELTDVLPELDPPLQFISPRSRVDFSYRAEDGLAEWTREFPEEAGRIHDLQTKIIAQAGGGHRRVLDLVEQVGLSPSWAGLADLQSPLYGSLVPGESRVGLANFYLTNAAKSVRFLIGGKDAFREILIARLKGYGGKVKRDARVEEIVFEGGRLVGALLSSFEGFVRSPVVIGNMNASSLLGLVPERLRAPSLANEVAALTPRYWRFNFSVRVPESVIPEGMGQHVCYHEPESDLGNGRMLQVFALPRGSYSGIAKGEKILLVRTLLPFEERTLRPEFLGVTMRRCLKVLEQFIPFISGNAMKIVPDPFDTANDPIYRNFYKFNSLGEIPIDLLVYGSSADGIGLNGVGTDWGKHGLGGVRLCARDVSPAQGIIGDIRTAMTVLNEIVPEVRA